MIIISIPQPGLGLARSPCTQSSNANGYGAIVIKQQHGRGLQTLVASQMNLHLSYVQNNGSFESSDIGRYQLLLYCLTLFSDCF